MKSLVAANVAVPPVRYARFEFPQAARDAERAGAAVNLGCDHAQGPAHVAMAAKALASLAGELKV